MNLALDPSLLAVPKTPLPPPTFSEAAPPKCSQVEKASQLARLPSLKVWARPQGKGGGRKGVGLTGPTKPPGLDV